MSNYKLEKTENKFLNINNFYIIQSEIIDGKKYSDIIYEFDNINQATSKFNLLQALEKI